MKTSLLIITLVILSTGVTAESTGDGFVVADGVTYFCQSLRTGLSNTKIVTTDGDIVRVPNNSVQAYRIKGHQFELLPLVDMGGDTVDYAFMEFLAMSDDSRLYRYCSNCRKYDPLNGEIAPLNSVFRYYILRNGQLKLLTDENETGKILSSFNVKVYDDRR
ncbi:MAG: hypothetical protein IPH20_15645 [Bacteroidales bacterium]|nr:hypothetical protein [Bacteroidales bacterium]